MVLVNNRDKLPWQPDLTVAKLLELCRYTSPHIHVFVNDELVPKTQWDTYSINDGDEVRVLHMIAGG